MEITNYKLRILDLAQRWRTNSLNAAEINELQNWFRSLEDQSLGIPVEMSVDLIEKRIHEMFESGSKRLDKKAGHLILLNNYYLPLNSFFSFSACKRRSSSATFSSYNSIIFSIGLNVH